MRLRISENKRVKGTIKKSKPLKWKAEGLVYIVTLLCGKLEKERKFEVLNFKLPKNSLEVPILSAVKEII